MCVYVCVLFSDMMTNKEHQNNKQNPITSSLKAAK